MFKQSSGWKWIQLVTIQFSGTPCTYIRLNTKVKTIPMNKTRASMCLGLSIFTFAMLQTAGMDIKIM
jgi:hypothetical protein